ncbi:PAS domain S-box protein [Desulforhopalus sp. 52FAK]
MDIIRSLLEEEFTVVSVGCVVELKKKSVIDYKNKKAVEPNTLDGIWSDVFDLLDDIVFIQDDRFRVIKANKAAQEFFGFSTASPQKTYCYQILTCRDSLCSVCAFRDYNATEFTCYSELLHKTSGASLSIKSSRIIHPVDGSIFVVHIAKIMARTEPSGSSTVKTDYSQGLEQELYRQKVLFETIFNSITDGIIITDINRVIQLANDGVLSTFGYRPEALVGKSAEVLYAYSNVFDEVGDKLFTEDASRNKILHQAKYRHRSGRIFLGEAFGTKLFNSNNEWIGNLGIMRDITDRNKDEKELRGLNAAIEQISDVVMITDYLGNITYVNPAFEEVTGYTQAEVLGRNPRLLQSGQNGKAFYRDFWNLITQGKTFTGRMVNKRKNGEIYTEESTVSPIVDSAGNVVSYVAIKRDITKQIQLENQLHQAQKMESVGRLTGGVAHDFNNILGVILGYAGMALRNSEPTDKLYNDLKIIHDAAKRSADIVRQLLMFSRQQAIAPEVIDINSGVDGMLNMLRRLIGEDIELRWQPHPQVLTIKIDPSQVDQILANLCVNARDAIAGTGKLTITTEKRVIEDDFLGNPMIFSPGDEVVQLKVTDNGEGIDEAEIDKIFEPFFTTKEKGQGTGLGLSTVYGIVQQNYGDISVTSSKGEGTCFTILFPLSVEPLSPGKGGGTTRLNEGQNETILLVEDDLTLLDMTRRMLEKTGYNVLMASGGSEALRRADKSEVGIDLLLTDVVMPEMNGKELSEQIKERIPDIKILYMSGYTSNVLGHNGVLDEGFELVAKPFSRKVLTDKIRALLDL